MARTLTDKDKKEIIEKYKQGVKIHALKKEYETTWFTVGKIIEGAGLELPPSDKWTKDDINKLKKLSNTYHYKDIAKMMGRTENAIYLKARRLGITLIMSKRKWTTDEEEYFKNYWGKMPIEALASELKRTVFSLKVKATRMNLGSMLSNTDKLSISEVSDILGVTRDRIVLKWIKLGLKVEKVLLGKEKEYMVVSYDNLIEFLKNNPYEWDSRNIDEELFPESEWLKKKKRWDEKNNPLFYRRWTDEELFIAIKMINEDKDYEEIAIEINRSKQAVAYMLRSLGYKLHEWNAYQNDFLISNYQDMTYKQIAEILNKSLDSVEYHIKKEGLTNKVKRRIK